MTYIIIERCVETTYNMGSHSRKLYNTYALSLVFLLESHLDDQPNRQGRSRQRSTNWVSISRDHMSVIFILSAVFCTAASNMIERMCMIG